MSCDHNDCALITVNVIISSAPLIKIQLSDSNVLKIQLLYDKLSYDLQSFHLNNCSGVSVSFPCSLFKTVVVERIDCNKFHLIALN